MGVVANSLQSATLIELDLSFNFNCLKGISSLLDLFLFVVNCPTLTTFPFTLNSCLTGDVAAIRILTSLDSEAS